MFYEHGGSGLPHQASSGGWLLLEESGSAAALLGACACSSSSLRAVTFQKEQITLSPASVCYINRQLT